ncbi:MAG: hypothetical protein OEZ01_07970 [Candidatus Heimdallarchaeota archaeon]|nr:hypothetical protein [Candidatus Heimdallarchaeota archaeon]MDH5645929.1 hypothetical protein [Candidatus Heimdallarchaeota archaeon]
MNDFAFFLVFIIVGLCTFFIRLSFLIKIPEIINNIYFKVSLESITRSLLIGLVIPYTLFVDGSFDILRIEVLLIVVTIPFLWVTNKPGISLPVVIILFLMAQIKF